MHWNKITDESLHSALELPNNEFFKKGDSNKMLTDIWISPYLLLPQPKINSKGSVYWHYSVKLTMLLKWCLWLRNHLVKFYDLTGKLQPISHTYTLYTVNTLQTHAYYMWIFTGIKENHNKSFKLIVIKFKGNV